MKVSLILFLLMFTIMDCGNQSAKKESGILTGWLTESRLLDEFPDYQAEKNAYQPEEHE